MELNAVVLARAVGIMQFEDLDPRNRIGRRTLVNGLAQQYSFTTYPKTLEELEIDKGLNFRVGQLDDINIEAIVVFRTAMVVETRSSTDDAERVLDHVLAWIAEQTKARARVMGRLFTSHLTFSMEKSLDALNPTLSELRAFVRERVAADFGPPRPVPPYETTGIEFDADSTQVRLQPGRVSIQRRASVPFTENRYWSEAPLRTQDHIALLERLELLL